ncbi:MAG: CPBP family intramembrane glutamic endopeptidase [Verrucomicrobiota bacterium]
MFLIANAETYGAIQIFKNILPLMGLSLFVAGLATDAALIYKAAVNRGWMRKGGEKLRRKPWTPRISVEIILWIILAWSIVGVLTPESANQAVDPDNIDGLSFVLHTLVLPVVLLGMTAWKIKSIGVTWQQSFGFRNQGFLSCLKKSVAAYLAAIPPASVAGYIILHWLNTLGYEIELQQTVRYLSRPGNQMWFNMYMAFLAIILAPVAEEILFRGIILPSVLKHCRTWLGVIFVSLLFAAIHGQAHFAAPLFVMGMAFALSYIATGSLVTPIIVHSLFNLVTVLNVLIRHDLPEIGL